MRPASEDWATGQRREAAEEARAFQPAPGASPVPAPTPEHVGLPAAQAPGDELTDLLARLRPHVVSWRQARAAGLSVRAQVEVEMVFDILGRKLAQHGR